MHNHPQFYWILRGYSIKVGSHEGTCCRDMSRGQSHRVNARLSWEILLRGRNFVSATCPLNSNQFELRGHVAATKQRYTPVKRKVASCELFMRHVPATLRKINQSENEITTCPCDKTLRVNTSRNLSPQHASSCEQRMKFFPATCPCNMSPRVSRTLQCGASVPHRQVFFLLSSPSSSPVLVLKLSHNVPRLHYTWLSFLWFLLRPVQ